MVVIQLDLLEARRLLMVVEAAVGVTPVERVGDLAELQQVLTQIIQVDLVVLDQETQEVDHLHLVVVEVLVEMALLATILLLLVMVVLVLQIVF